MARQKSSAQSIRKLSKVGSGKSYSITIPIDMIRRLGWKERQKLVVNLRDATITIKDWKK